MRYIGSRPFLLTLILLASLTLESSNEPHPPDSGQPDNDSFRGAASQQEMRVNYSRLPLSFEANQGQTDNEVKFFSRGSGYHLYLTATEAVLQLRPSEVLKRHSGVEGAKGQPADTLNPILNSRVHRPPSPIVRMKLIGANPASPVSGHEALPGKTNYFIGNDPTKWRTNVPNYAKVTFDEVWPGVKLVYYGNQRQLEYDFVIEAGADPGVIKISFEGSEKVEVNSQGDLVLRITGGDLVLRKPFVYQEVEGKRKEITSSYILDDTGQASFQVGAYDAERPLVIDPVLVYSTYLGGLNDDIAYSIALDSEGNVYTAGITSSSNFPRVSPLQPNYGGAQDVFVTKINASGSALVYSTYIGGNGSDDLGGLALDASGNAYFTGTTGSTNFPSVSAFQPTLSGTGDAYLTKLNSSGSALVYSTYLGGSGGESGRGVAVNPAGNVYVVGATNSTNFPRAQALQTNFGGQIDVFITKFNPAGTGLVYSTYFGGSDVDAAYGVALDGADNVYLAGDTSSSNFPKLNAAQPTYGGSGDAFVAKLLTSGTALGYSTYLGGSGEDSAAAIATDAGGNAYITGETSSTNFPMASPLQAAKGSGSDAFVTKVNQAGALAYSTYLGGSNSGFNDSDAGNDIAIDVAGNAHLTGFTTSPNFPVQNPIQATNNNGGEAFVAKLNPAGSALLHSTFLGGTGYDNGHAIAVDTGGNVYIAGQTRSTNFPTKNPLQASIGSAASYDAFIVKISDSPACPGLNFANGFAGPMQSCLATLRIDTKAEIYASDPAPVDVTARKADGTLDTSFTGTVQVNLAPDSTPKIGCLKSGGQCAASLSVALAGGILTQPLALVTPLLQPPGTELTGASVIKLGDTVLKGTALIKAESGSITTMSVVNVRSPLDLKIKSVEVQQGVNQGPAGLWIGERDLLIRVFLDANREGPDKFDKYQEIQGVTAKLIVKDKAGNEIGTARTLSKSRINSRNEPEGDYVFVPNIQPQQDGADSLNYVLNPGFEQQLNLEVKLDDAIPDRNDSNDSVPIAPLNFGISRSVKILYSKLRVLNDKNSTGFPKQIGVDREIEFIKQAWPASSRSLRFVPQDDETSTTNPVTGDPGSRFLSLGFWINAFSKTGVRYVYFVDKNYFDNILNDRCTDGVTPAEAFPTIIFNRVQLTTFFSIVNSDRCATYPDKCGVLAHELGHTFALGDTYKGSGTTVFTPNRNPRGCNGTCTETDNGNLAEFGHFSWFHHQFITRDRPYLDFMGNGGPYVGLCHGGSSDNSRTWADLQTWNYLKSELVFAPQNLQPQQAAQNAAGNFVIVQGQVNKNGTASFGNCYTLPLTDLENSVETGSYVIETLDANSAILNSSGFTPKFKAPHLALELERSDFSFALPFSNAVKQIRLRSGGAVLATRAVSTNAPTARFISDFGGLTLTGTQQVTWAGSDADGDALSYSLFYSPDGELRIPLLTETAATSYAWNTDAQPSGPAPMLTLVATDGVNATVVDSRPFALPNRPPRITIYSPGDQFQFKAGEPVTLEGSLFDPEEDLNLNPPLQWSSNLRGALGTGKQITVNNLQAGTHLITASGVDSEDGRGSASVTVIVRPDNFSNLAVAQPNLDFGSVVVGQTRDQTLLVNNTGNVPFTVNAITSNNARFSVTAPAAPFTVAARAQQEVRVRFTPLTPSTQAGSLTVTSNASNQTSLNVAMLGTGSGPSVGVLATVSAASFSTAPVAREAIVAGFGASLAGSVEVASSVPLPTQLAGTSVRVKDSTGQELLAPLFFVSPSQINYQIPTGAADGPATITVTTASGSISIGAITIVALSPGLFTANSDGKGVPAGYAIRIKPDNSQITESVLRFDSGQNKFLPAPIDFGPPADQIILVLFGTGLRHRSSLSDVTCVIGGVPAQVGYAGPQGSFLGLDQINVGLPRSLAGRGEVDLVLTVQGQSNTVRVAFAAGTTLCDYTIAPLSQSFSSSGGVGIVNVAAPAGCAWTAVSNATWLVITSGNSGNGPGGVNYFVAANTTTAQRSGTLTIAGRTFTVTQAAAASAVTVLGRRTALGPIPMDCAPPELKTSFLTTDVHLYQWTLVSGARVGDQVRWEFSPVSGSFLQSAQYTVQFDGSLCFWAPMEIAGAPASSFTGNWQVRVFYNNGLLFTDTFTISNAVTVTDQRMTAGPIPDQCVAPQAKTTFAQTDARAYQWLLLGGVKIGDLVRWEFVQPNGTVYFSTETALAFEGNVCLSAFINIAGAPAAILPGNWQVRVLCNGAPLVTASFTIAASAIGFQQHLPFLPGISLGGSGATRVP